MEKLTFEQLPQAIMILIEKVNLLSSKVEDVLQKAAPLQEDQHRPLSLDDVANLLGKSASTIYAMTSNKRIPFHKRGNKLYFFEDEIIQWIEQGETAGKEDDFNRRLEELRNGKKRKPGSPAVLQCQS